MVNEDIRFSRVLLIGPNGDSLGVRSRDEALVIAEENNLDLFCVAPQATPPVCKVLNYGKYRFEMQKKAREAKKKQVVVETKEVQLTPVIAIHDLETKVRNSLKFLSEGDKIKVVVKFRRREISHPEVGEEVIKTFIEKCSEKAVVEKPAVMDGKTLIAILAPKKTA